MLEFYPFPEKEEPSKLYTVTVNGKKVDCYSATVSAWPINQVWPGYQRPVEQTEQTAFVTFGTDDDFSMTVTANEPCGEVTIRPLSKNVKAAVDGKSCEFILPGAGQYTCEFGDRHHVLHIFVNPIKEFDVDREDENTIYFDRGVYFMDEPLELSDNQTVYIERGAVVYGSFKANGSRNIRVLGYGIVDNSTFERGKGNPFTFSRCENVYVEGITIRDSSEWTMHFSGCNNCIADNIKLIGMWRYNSDGVDMTNSTNCVLRNSFLRNYDDCVVVKGLVGNTDRNVCNIFVENCVTWCDWGRNLEIGAETCADYFKNVCFKNCDCIHLTMIALDVQHGDRALVSDISFEDIRVEYDEKFDRCYLQTKKGEQYENGEAAIPELIVVNTVRTIYSKDDHTGIIDGVKFKNIKVFAEGKIPSSKIGPVGAGTVKNVTLENLVIDGKQYTNAYDANITSMDGSPLENMFKFI